MIALALAARMFVGYLYPYYALDWMPADEARPPPRTVLVDLACKARDGPPDCGHQAWDDTLKDYHEQPLRASAGGRSYRVITRFGGYSSNPTLFRLDVDPSGVGRLHMVSIQTNKDKKVTDRYAEQTVPVTAEQVQAFETALDSSLFDVNPPEPKPNTNGSIPINICMDGTNVAVEAVKDGKYRWVVDPCGFRMKFGPILNVLTGVDHQPW